jgi:hypothetical protein
VAIGYQARACTHGEGRLHHTHSMYQQRHAKNTATAHSCLPSTWSAWRQGLSASRCPRQQVQPLLPSTAEPGSTYVPAHDHDGDARVHRELDVQEQGHRDNDRGAQSRGGIEAQGGIWGQVGTTWDSRKSQAQHNNWQALPLPLGILPHKRDCAAFIAFPSEPHT